MRSSVRRSDLKRWSGKALVAALLVLIGMLSSGETFLLYLMAAVSVLALDTRHLASLRNIIVTYHFIMLGLAPSIYGVDNVNDVRVLGIVLLLTFALGFLVRRSFGSKPSPQGARAAIVTVAAGDRVGENLLRLAIAYEVVLVLVDLVRFGPVGYFSGAALNARFVSNADGGGVGLFEASKLISSVFVVAVVAVYAYEHDADRRYNWRLLLLALFWLPLLRLERSALVPSVLVLLVLVARQGGSGFGWARRRSVWIALALILTVVSALGFGALRAAQMGTDTGGPYPLVLIGEMSPVLVVSASIRPRAPRYNGDGLFLPLVTRYLPRRWFPDKPFNTIARYMKQTDPKSFAAGFMNAPTGVGAIVLNYGVLAVLFISLLLGLLVGGPATGGRDIGRTVVVYYCSYFLMRDDPSNSVALLITALMAYALLRNRASRRWRVLA